jgi:hypothetical protein
MNKKALPILKQLGEQVDQLIELRGGPGSGNFGHSGRPGQVGGSGGGSASGGGASGGVQKPKPSGGGAAATEKPAEGKPTAKSKLLELNTVQESTAFLKEHYGQWKAGLSKEEKYALAVYQSPSGFPIMNAILRGKKPLPGSEADQKVAKKAIKGLKAAIDKAPGLPSDTAVWRGFSKAQFGELKPGDVIDDAGFLSTSLYRDGAGAFPGGGGTGPQYLSRIRLPKGTKAAGGDVKELTLPPGAKMRVVAGTEKGVLELELI